MFHFDVEEFIKFIIIVDKASILSLKTHYDFSLTPLFHLFAGLIYVDFRGVNFIEEGFSLKFFSVLI